MLICISFLLKEHTHKSLQINSYLSLRVWIWGNFKELTIYKRLWSFQKENSQAEKLRRNVGREKRQFSTTDFLEQTQEWRAWKFSWTPVLGRNFFFFFLHTLSWDRKGKKYKLKGSKWIPHCQEIEAGSQIREKYSRQRMTTSTVFASCAVCYEVSCFSCVYSLWPHGL